MRIQSVLHSSPLQVLLFILNFLIGIQVLQLINVCVCKNQESNAVRKFPADFKWGVGSSAYQVEGGWNADGKGESIWDRLTHDHPDKMPDYSSGNQTSDSYHQWQHDVRIVRKLGVKIYRFSLSWPRILPTGYANEINQPGLQYYSNLIDELLYHNVTPMVTLYHWDLPQKLQDLGGWANAEMIPLFEDYAKIAFEQFGDRVKLWTTFNEPWHVCEQAYGQDYMAPALNYPGIPSYLCGHTLLKAHAEVVHMYKDRYQAAQNGYIGITLDTSWPEPLTDSDEDKAASEIALQFYVGWFAHPIFSKTGNYPQTMMDRVAALSKQQGYPRSRLPRFTAAEVHRIRGTSDFFGINSYTTVLVKPNDRMNSANFPIPSFPHDMGVVESFDPTWPKSGSVWLHVVPFGMYKLLSWIRQEYDNPLVFVTENGVSDRGGTNDLARIDYLYSYLDAVLDAIEDGCNVRGYIAWSLMDSFEWRSGFTEKFGLYHVDFKHPNRTRTPKASAKVYARIARTGQIDWSYRPKPDVLIVASPQLSEVSSADQSTATGIVKFIFLALAVAHMSHSV